MINNNCFIYYNNLKIGYIIINEIFLIINEFYLNKLIINWSQYYISNIFIILKNILYFYFTQFINKLKQLLLNLYIIWLIEIYFLFIFIIYLLLSIFKDK